MLWLLMIFVQNVVGVLWRAYDCSYVKRDIKIEQKDLQELGWIRVTEDPLNPASRLNSHGSPTRCS